MWSYLPASIWRIAVGETAAALAEGMGAPAAVAGASVVLVLAIEARGGCVNMGGTGGGGVRLLATGAYVW